MNVGADRPIPIQLPAGLWVSIDATIDNTVDMASVDGDEETADVGRGIRRAGRAQVPWQDGQWPPTDTDVTIALTRDQWQYTLDQIIEWQVTHEQLDEIDGVEQIAALIASHPR